MKIFKLLTLTLFFVISTSAFAVGPATTLSVVIWNNGIFYTHNVNTSKGTEGMIINASSANASYQPYVTVKDANGAIISKGPIVEFVLTFILKTGLNPALDAAVSRCTNMITLARELSGIPHSSSGSVSLQIEAAPNKTLPVTPNGITLTLTKDTVGFIECSI